MNFFFFYFYREKCLPPFWEKLQKDILEMGFPDDLDGKESAPNERDWGSIPGLGRSPGERNG